MLGAERGPAASPKRSGWSAGIIGMIYGHLSAHIKTPERSVHWISPPTSASAMTSRAFGHRAPLLWLALPLMAGLAIGKIGSFLPVGWLLGLACVQTLFAVWSAWRAPAWWPCLMIAALFLAGAAS